MLKRALWALLAGEWQKLAPFRILSVDIECAGRKVPHPCPSPVHAGHSMHHQCPVKAATVLFTIRDLLQQLATVLPGMAPSAWTAPRLENEGPWESRAGPAHPVKPCLWVRARVQGHFPEAEKDPVIQIASLVTEQGQAAPVVRNVMTLGTCAPIVGAEVMAFAREEDLLKVGPGWEGPGGTCTGAGDGAAACGAPRQAATQADCQPSCLTELRMPLSLGGGLPARVGDAWES